MACDENTRILISAFADGETSAEETVLAKAHLAECEECRTIMAEWSSDRRIVEWAYRDLPPAALPRFESTAQKGENQMSSIVAQKREPFWTRLRGSKNIKRLRWAAAAVSAIAVIWLTVGNRPPQLAVGGVVANTGSKSITYQSDNASLSIGPNTRLTRTAKTVYKLERGWVIADVGRGPSIEIKAPRMTVQDIGTEFMVATGSKGDSVCVMEGSVNVNTRTSNVNVNEGEILLADGNGRYSHVRSEDTESRLEGLSLKDATRYGFRKPDGSEPEFVPDTAASLDWDMGLSLLAHRRDQRFGEIKWEGMSSMLTMNTERGPAAASIGPVKGVSVALRKRIAEVTRVMAGQPTAEDWSIPVTLILTDELMGAVKLPRDTYLLSLVSHRGKLLWRFEGARGASAEAPVEFGRIPSMMKGVMPFRALRAQPFGSEKSGEWAIYLAAWQGDMKPRLRLTFAGDPSKYSDDSAKALAQELGLREEPNPRNKITLYLDPERNDKLEFWTFEEPMRAGDILKGKWLAMEQKRSYLFAIKSSRNLTSPQLPAGAYTLMTDLGAPKERRRWTISGRDSSVLIPLETKPADVKDKQHNFVQSSSLYSFGYINLVCSVIEPTPKEYRFHVKLMKQLKDGEELLVEGWFGISRP